MYLESAQVFRVNLAAKLVADQVPLLCTISDLCIGNIQKIQAKRQKFPKSKAFEGKR